jgi:carboxypeptidase PM20D1
MPIHTNSLAFLLFSTIAPYLPFAKRILMKNLWLFKSLVANKFKNMPIVNAMMRTTMVPTIFTAGHKNNIIPNSASVTINYRLYPGDTKEAMLAYISNQLSDMPINIEVVDDFPAPPISAITTYGYKTITMTIRQISQVPVVVAPAMTIGATDARHFEKITDSTYNFLYIRGTIEDFKGYHGLNEKLSIENYCNSIKFYYQLIKNSQQAELQAYE